MSRKLIFNSMFLNKKIDKWRLDYYFSQVEFLSFIFFSLCLTLRMSQRLAKFPIFFVKVLETNFITKVARKGVSIDFK